MGGHSGGTSNLRCRASASTQYRNNEDREEEFFNTHRGTPEIKNARIILFYFTKADRQKLTKVVKNKRDAHKVRLQFGTSTLIERDIDFLRAGCFGLGQVQGQHTVRDLCLSLVCFHFCGQS